MIIIGGSLLADIRHLVDALPKVLFGVLVVAGLLLYARVLHLSLQELLLVVLLLRLASGRLFYLLSGPISLGEVLLFLLHLEAARRLCGEADVVLGVRGGCEVAPLGLSLLLGEAHSGSRELRQA